MAATLPPKILKAPKVPKARKLLKALETSVGRAGRCLATGPLVVVWVEPFCNWDNGFLAKARIRKQGNTLSAVDALGLVVAEPPPEPHLRSKRNQTQSCRLMNLTLAVEPLALAQVVAAVDLVASALAQLPLAQVVAAVDSLASAPAQPAPAQAAAAVDPPASASAQPAQEARALAMPLPTMKRTALQRAATEVPSGLAAMLTPGTPGNALPEEVCTNFLYSCLCKECCYRYESSCSVQSQKRSYRPRRNCDIEISHCR